MATPNRLSTVIFSVDGEPIEGALLIADLDRPDYTVLGTAFPNRTVGTSNALGEVSVDIVSNLLGTQDSRYAISIKLPDGPELARSLIQMPTVDATLEQLVDKIPLTSEYTTAAAISAARAQELADEVEANVGDIVDNLPEIINVNDNMPSVISVANNEVNIGLIGANIESIDAVADNEANIDIVAGGIANVNLVGASIADVNIVANDIDSVILTADNLPAIEAAPGAALDAANSAQDAEDARDETLAALTIQDNLTATTDPTVNDDSSLGYEPFSRWFNTSNQTLWVLTDATPGAASWFDTGWQYFQLGSASLAQIGTGPTEVPTNNMLPKAAFVANGSTVDQLRNALVAAGLMASA